MTRFQYDQAILAAYPNLVGGVILASDLHNSPTGEALGAEYLKEQQAAIARIGTTPLSEIPALAAWRTVFRSFGVDPTQYRSAAESLLRRLTKKGDIPSINTLVDLANLVSIRYALPVAVFDTRALQGTLTVQIADGTQRFTTLNQDETENPPLGEVVFADDSKAAFARRWCWRQSDDSAARLETTAAIITVEGHHATAQADVQAALNDLLALLPKYAGGKCTSALLGKTQPAI